MSTVVRPAGPLPRRVYWVRRLLLLLIVLAMVWGVTRWIRSGESDAQGEAGPSPVAQQVTESASPTATPTPNAEQPPSKREKRRARLRQERQERQERQDRREANRVRTVTAVLPRPDVACDLTQVAVLASVQPGAEARGEVDVQLAFSTLQPEPCTLDLDADRLLLSITADDEPVWTSTRCRGAVPEQTVVLRPFWTTTVQVSWTGQRAGGRCSPAAKFAAPGQYELQSAVLTGEPATTAFTLLEPPPPAPKPERDDDAQAGGDAPDADASDSDPGPGADPDAGGSGAQSPTGEGGADDDGRPGGAPEPGDEELSENG